MTEARQEMLRYCLSCGEEVPTYQVDKVGEVETRCAYCGLPLEITPRARGLVPECVILADDEMLFRSLLSKLLEEEGLARQVIACESGPALLTECVQRLRDRLPIDLVILDILMTPMDGPTAGLALRAVEKGFGLPEPVPILFFSAVRADENLRRQLGYAAPAFYLNKGSDATPARVAQRLRELFPRLLAAGKGR
ncbi:MAG: response regulator [Candidatus Methylomirabilales bacterium]